MCVCMLETACVYMFCAAWIVLATDFGCGFWYCVRVTDHLLNLGLRLSNKLQSGVYSHAHTLTNTPRHTDRLLDFGLLLSNDL